MKDYELPGEARPPFGSLRVQNASDGLNLLLTAQTAYYTAQTAAIQLKVSLAQQVILQAEHIQQQVYATSDIPTKIDLTHQADALYSKVVHILFNLFPPDDETLSSITNATAN